LFDAPMHGANRRLTRHIERLPPLKMTKMTAVIGTLKIPLIINANYSSSYYSKHTLLQRETDCQPTE
jgi:hypothetical protein